MAINFLPNPVYRFKDTSDNVLVGGLVFTYDTGTTNKQTVWKDKGKVAAHTNPIVLDSRGEAEIWFDGTIDLVTAPAGDTDPPSSPVETVTGAQSSIDPASSAQSGLILNPSFEASGVELTNWTSTPASGATITIDATDPVDGSNSVKFTAGGSGGGKLESEFISVTEGNILVVNGMIKSDSTSLTNELKISFYDKDKASVSTVTAYTNNAVSTITWAEFHGEADIPANAVWCKVELHGSSAGSGATFFDRIILNQPKDTDFGVIYPQEGLVLNSSFERGIGLPRHWTPSVTAGGTIILDTANFNHGSKSLKMVSGGVSGAGSIVSRFIAVAPSAALSINALVKSANTATTNLIKLAYYDESKASTSTSTVYDNSGTSLTSWSEARGVDVVPAGSYFVRVELHGSTAAAGTTHFDRVLLINETNNLLKMCYLTGAVNSVANNTSVIATWPTEVSDPFNTHAANSSNIVIPSWCNYIKATAAMHYGGVAGGSYRRVDLYNLTSSVSIGFNTRDIDLLIGLNYLSVADSGIVAVSSSDNIQVRVKQDSGGTRTIGSSSRFVIEMFP